MTKFKPRKLLAWGLGIALVAVAALMLNWHRMAHLVFDSHRWQTDIYARRDLLDASGIKVGMTENQVRKLYGNPELEEGGKEGTVFTYLMPTYQIPTGINKGVYFVRFKNGVVVDTIYDDSGWDVYDQAEEKSKKLGSN